MSCKRSRCPVCYPDWARETAKKDEKRILAFRPYRYAKVIHITVSPSVPDEDGRKAQAVAKMAGFLGGSSYIHPFRERCGLCGLDKARCQCLKFQGVWYYSPHWHMVGYGWIKKTASIYEETGWLVKNKGIRESVYGTIFYLLTHAGVSIVEGKGRKNTVTWFGALSFNKFHHKPLRIKRKVCPLCASELVPLVYYGQGDPPGCPKEGGEFFFEKSVLWLTLKDLKTRQTTFVPVQTFRRGRIERGKLPSHVREKEPILRWERVRTKTGMAWTPVDMELQD